MTETHDPDASTRGRKVHSEAVWSSLRDAYLAGEAGEAAAARHGVAPATFWKRARREGWRRSEQPEAPPPAFDPDRPAMNASDQLDLIDRRVSWALEAGAASEALRWLRMRERIEVRAQRQAEMRARLEAVAAKASARENMACFRDLAAATRDLEQAALANRRRLRAEAQGESGQPKNSPGSREGFLDPDAPNLSRAERRRRARYLSRHGP
jgi:hypothetical protein